MYDETNRHSTSNFVLGDLRHHDQTSAEQSTIYDHQKRPKTSGLSSKQKKHKNQNFASENSNKGLLGSGTADLGGAI